VRIRETLKEDLIELSLLSLIILLFFIKN